MTDDEIVKMVMDRIRIAVEKPMRIPSPRRTMFRFIRQYCQNINDSYGRGSIKRLDIVVEKDWSAKVNVLIHPPTKIQFIRTFKLKEF
jgi:hypothetical protein